MAIVYLEPDDLSAAQQTRILRVLNLAVDANALATAIEIAGEPDIGVRLAERLIRAREALGGQFTLLSQVASVPQVGHERFTDLCVAILGLQREQLARLGDVAGHRLAAATVSGFDSASFRVQIQTDPQPAWTGQQLNITVIASRNGVPLVNRVITLESSQGELTSMFGFAVQNGSALQLRTGADGKARAILNLVPGEPLTRDQHTALQLALATLDPLAETPERIRVEFQALASAYDDERNIHLRRAIDIYSRHGQQFWQRTNAQNAEYEWQRESSVLRAWLHTDDSSQQVLSSAVAIVRWLNWVPAWFTFLHDWLANRAGLVRRMHEIKQKGVRGYALVDSLVGEAHSFVAGQKGFAAELVSQHLVRDSVTRFMSTELEDVDDNTRQVLFPALELAAEQIRAGNRGSLELVANTRGTLKADIDNIARIDTDALGELFRIRDDVNARANSISEQIERLSRSQTKFDTDYASFSQKYANFDASYSTFNSNYATFNSNYTNFNSNYASFNTRYNTFDSSYATFNNNYTRFNVDLGKFNTDYGNFNQERVVLARDIANVNTEIGALKIQNTQINTQVAALNSNVTQVKTDISGINQRIIRRGPGG